MSLEEFAELVQLDPAQVRDWTAAGLLDPEREGRFDDLDLLRLMAIRHYEALGFSPEQLAKALSSGEIEPFLGEYIYPRGTQLTLDEAAERTRIDPDVLRDLRTALGWARSGFLEADLRMLEGFKAIAASGMPREALLEALACWGTPCGASPRRWCASYTFISTSG
jgi:DNA-binding transcriptional MerR regulator